MPPRTAAQASQLLWRRLRGDRLSCWSLFGDRASRLWRLAWLAPWTRLSPQAWLAWRQPFWLGTLSQPWQASSPSREKQSWPFLGGGLGGFLAGFLGHGCSFLRVQRFNCAARPTRRLAAVSSVNPAFAPDAFSATVQMARFEDLARFLGHTPSFRRFQRLSVMTLQSTGDRVAARCGANALAQICWSRSMVTKDLTQHTFRAP